MSENVSPISIIKRLHELDLFFVTTRTLADLFQLPLTRVYQLVGQLREMNLLAEVENGKYLVLGFEPSADLAAGETRSWTRYYAAGPDLATLTDAALAPNDAPPCFTLGHETLSSPAATAGYASTRSARRG